MRAHTHVSMISLFFRLLVCPSKDYANPFTIYMKPIENYIEQTNLYKTCRSL